MTFVRGAITEGPSVDFKSRLELKEDRAKALFTVGAFLNANSAYVYVGVREGKNHVFERLEPYDGDADEKRR